MALFTSYAPPGVYTQEIFVPQAANAVGTARIPVIIGEGEQFFTFANVELPRGSSASQDEQAVNENISPQVTGLTRSFNTTYFPVTDGDGTVSNDPTKIQAVGTDADGNSAPVTVITLDGTTGAFTTQDIIPTGTDLVITYSFLTGDTEIVAEILTPQIPIFATGTVDLGGGNTLVLTLTSPGAVGNLVTVELTDGGVGSGVVDAQAVTSGTNTILINIRNTDNSFRTLTSLKTLINSTSIATASAGFLVAGTLSGTGSTALVGLEINFTGGQGQNQNITFKVANVPITDGTNGGVVTTNPANVTVLYDGNPAVVTAVDGANGLITLANPALNTHTLVITYFTNTLQNTSDLLPASAVASIVEVGLGPNRSDFTQGTDFVLGVDSNGNPIINWGASTSTVSGVSNGAVTFDATQITTSLRDEKVYLRPTTGSVDGKNLIFTLPDQPTDGSGRSIVTDKPSLITAYVGTDPVAALTAGAVTVARLSGAAKQVTLYNPPQVGQLVFVTYFRNVLNDHVFTVTVDTPGTSGVGTYHVADELGNRIPVATFDKTDSSVTAGGFTTAGLVWPNSTPDLVAEAGAVNETVTCTFNTNAYFTGGSVAQQAAVITQGITFTASTAGVTGNKIDVAFTNSPAVADATAVSYKTGSVTAIAIASNVLTVTVGNSFRVGQTVVITGLSIATYLNSQLLLIASQSGTQFTATFTHANDAQSDTGTATDMDYLVIDILKADGSTTRTTSEIVELFQNFPARVTTTEGGVIIATGGNHTAAVVAAVTPLVGGAASTLSGGYSMQYTVSSTAPGGTTGTGYVGQTYQDAATGLKFTIVDPNTASTPYRFVSGDFIKFVVSKASTFTAGSVVSNLINPTIAIPGLIIIVASTANTSAGDTALVTTTNKSGNEPNVGDFYYVTFTTAKTAADYGLKIFTNPSDAYAQYGQPSTINRLSLGIQLMSLNGVQSFGAIQVPVQPGTNFGSSSDFITALAEVTKNLPGFNRKADVVVPLSNDPVVHQALSRQLITQAGPRYKGEAIGFVGYSQFTTANGARANSRALNNQRMIAIGNAAAGILITNLRTGASVEYAVDGPFMAAAMAGLNCNPSNDVATTLTLQNLVGFSRLLITYDDPTMDFMAADGLTLLLNNNGALQIRHYKSTDPSDDLTSEPTSTTTADFVAQQFRRDLQQFIGRKLIDSLVSDITVVCNARLKSLMDNVLIDGYENLIVAVDDNDPTQVDVTVTFKPIFSLLYASVTFVVQTSL